MTNYHMGFYCTSYLTKRLESIKIKKYGIDVNDSQDLEDCPYEDADDFRQGSCQLFARALNETFGYPTYQISKENLHCFCIAEWNNDGKVVPVYIDVRGITTDFKEFLKTSSLNDDCKESDIEPMEKDEVPGEFDDVGLAFSKAIIKDFTICYDLSELGKYPCR